VGPSLGPRHSFSKKDFGGLGIINTRHLNEALILKWDWRLQNLDGEDMCCQLLKAKYFPHKSFARSNNKTGSQFWMGVNKVRENLKWGCAIQITSGDQTLFRDDVWVGHVPLKIIFPELYNC
jgi:hypothetical protein